MQMCVSELHYAAYARLAEFYMCEDPGDVTADP